MNTERKGKSGPAFLTQCACFECRKVFKKDLADPRYQPKCPQCGRQMHDMGRFFRAPRHADKKQWLKVEMLHRAGIHFKSHEFGPLPTTLLEARRFIIANEEALTRSATMRENWRAKAVAELVRAEQTRKSARKASKERRARTLAEVGIAP